MSTITIVSDNGMVTISEDGELVKGLQVGSGRQVIEFQTGDRASGPDAPYGPPGAQEYISQDGARPAPEPVAAKDAASGPGVTVAADRQSQQDFADAQAKFAKEADLPSEAEQRKHAEGAGAPASEDPEAERARRLAAGQPADDPGVPKTTENVKPDPEIVEDRRKVTGVDRVSIPPAVAVNAETKASKPKPKTPSRAKSRKAVGSRR